MFHVEQLKPYYLVNRFVQQKLGGPSLSEYEKLQAEMSDLQIRYNELLALHQETCNQVYFLFVDSFHLIIA